MLDLAMLKTAVLVWIGFAPVIFLALLFVTAPYGRHARSGWGPSLPAKAGWVIMEFPAVTLFFAFYLISNKVLDPVPTVMVILWQIHYLNRTFVFPFRMAGNSKPMPLSIALFGFCFNLFNGAFNGAYTFGLTHYSISWLWDPRFIIGVGLFFGGLFINLQSDSILRNLRKPGETGYKIPQGGMYRFVSCPNYFGEILEWGGWALLTWNLGGLSFFIWSFANLAPRAIQHHKWYKKTFENYPENRKAVIPFIL